MWERIKESWDFYMHECEYQWIDGSEMPPLAYWAFVWSPAVFSLAAIIITIITMIIKFA